MKTCNGSNLYLSITSCTTKTKLPCFHSSFNFILTHLNKVVSSRTSHYFSCRDLSGCLSIYVGKAKRISTFPGSWVIINIKKRKINLLNGLHQLKCQLNVFTLTSRIQKDNYHTRLHLEDDNCLSIFYCLVTRAV